MAQPGRSICPHALAGVARLASVCLVPAVTSVSGIELYFDLGSPYAYLAVARAEKALGLRPTLRPVLLGAIFKARGFGSWSQTAQLDQRVAEIEDRARRYGLPPMRWPAGWPLKGLGAMRACVWAEAKDQLDPFVHAVYEHEFVRGEDVAPVSALAIIADEVGLPGSELPDAVQSQSIKDRLRDLTGQAWHRGVRGVPTIAVGDTLFYGDDQLANVPLLIDA